MATPRFSVLTDQDTQAVLTLSTNTPAIVFLNQSMDATYRDSSVSHPNYTKSFFLAELPPAKYPEWRWDRKTRTFVKIAPHLLSNALRERARLAHMKLLAIIRIMRNINIARDRLNTGVHLQETAYLLKRLEAEKFKASGYDENLILEIPFVAQYAELADITLREASDDILLKAKIAEQDLARTELLRLMYYRRIRETSSPDDIPTIMEEFYRDCYVNARV